MSLETCESSVPRLESEASCAFVALSWFFQGVSTPCRFDTIWLTVWLTLKPAPLMGEPKLIPTVPMHASSHGKARSEPFLSGKI